MTGTSSTSVPVGRHEGDALAAWLEAADRAELLRGPGGPPIGEMTRLTSYAEIDEVLTSKDFVQAGGGNRTSAPLTIHSLVSLSGEDHFERRLLLSALVRMRSIARLERDVLREIIADVLREAAAQRGADGVVRSDLVPLGRSIFVRLSAAIVGLDGSSSPDAVARLCEHATKFQDGVDVERTPRDPAVVLREALDAKREFIREFFAPSWARREAMVEEWRAGRRPASDLPNDLITIMVRDRLQYARWDLDVFVREARVFVSAGTLSPATALAHAVAELSTWLRANPHGRGRLHDTDFLRSALSEAMRMHVGGSAKIRRALRDTKLRGGRRVREGEHFYLDEGAANHDPAVFGPDADVFRPDRQVRDAPHYGVSFGGGPHMCLGKGLAVGESRGREDAPVGAVVRVLADLYAAGIEIDDAREAQKRLDSPLDEYASFPVRFDRL